MLVDELLVDRPDDVEVDLDSVEIQQRHTEFVRGRDGNCPGFREILVDQVSDERHFLAACGFRGFGKLILSDDAVLDEAPWQAREVGL